MIEDHLLFVITSVSFLIITKDFMDIYLAGKNLPAFQKFCIWGAFYIIEAVGTEYIKIPICLLCFELISSFILSCILYNGNVRKKIFLVFIVNLFGMLTESFVGFIFIFMNISMTESINILGSLLSKVIQFTLIMCLRIFQSKLKKEIDLKHWIILLVVPIGSIFVLNSLFVSSENIQRRENMILSLISSILILGLNLLVFRIYEDLSEKFELQKQQSIFQKEIDFYKNQMEEREETFSNIRKIKHDMNNYLICLDNYLEQGNLGKARSYINYMLMGKDDIQPIDYNINTGNSVVDVLLHYKVNLIKKYHITLETHIEIPNELKIDDIDICIIVGNCLDNAIEALKELNENYSKRIHIDIIYRKGALMIKIKNPFVGERKKDLKGNYISTKVDNENHGIGLYSVKKVIEKYNGLITFQEMDSEFEVQIFLYTM